MKRIPAKTPKGTDSAEAPSNAAIRIRNISKMYPLYSHPQARLMQSLWHAIPGFLRGNRRPEFYKEFWALRDVTLQIKRGETVGIVGRNGSGKSTLLQIIAGTLTPTTGEGEVSGRLAALLELGSGFNPEFSGRENVYLNGAILGLSRTEIDARFSEIESFAGIGQFMDQPVKIYSSGMFARLTFSVVAHIDPDILIVDEAISVGDAEFQRRCMQRMKQLCQGGTTVLLVSHDLHTVERFSSRVIVLDKGYCMADDDAKTAVGFYQDMISKEAKQETAEQVPLAPETRDATGEVELESIVLLDAQDQRTTVFSPGDVIRLHLTYKIHQPIIHPHFGISIWTQDEIRVGQAHTIFNSATPIASGLEGQISVRCELHSTCFMPGRYYLRGGVYDENLHFPFCLWGWTGEKKGEFYIASKTVNDFVLKNSLGFVLLPSRWWMA